jgi:hypothetical protein
MWDLWGGMGVDGEPWEIVVISYKLYKLYLPPGQRQMENLEKSQGILGTFRKFLQKFMEWEIWENLRQIRGKSIGIIGNQGKGIHFGNWAIPEGILRIWECGGYWYNKVDEKIVKI